MCIDLNSIKSYNMILIKIYLPENSIIQGYFAEMSLGTWEENQSFFQFYVGKYKILQPMIGSYMAISNYHSSL